jgi:hypothetical protein
VSHVEKLALRFLDKQNKNIFGFSHTFDSQRAEAGCYYKKKDDRKTLQIKKFNIK